MISGRGGMAAGLGTATPKDPRSKSRRATAGLKKPDAKAKKKRGTLFKSIFT